jgi:hypothetical protein
MDVDKCFFLICYSRRQMMRVKWFEHNWKIIGLDYYTNEALVNDRVSIFSDDNDGWFLSICKLNYWSSFFCFLQLFQNWKINKTRNRHVNVMKSEGKKEKKKKIVKILLVFLVRSYSVEKKSQTTWWIKRNLRCGRHLKKKQTFFIQWNFFL